MDLQSLELADSPKAHFRAGLEDFLWQIWRGERRLLSALLLPFSALFGLVVFFRGQFYRWGIFKRHRLPVPVISVGNLVVGGAGKTPVVLEVASRLQSMGRKVGILSRGHGRADENALVIVSDGEAVRATPEEGGDEPVWLAHALPGSVVVVCADRLKAAEQALELGADLLVLDDAFSHLALHRDIDLLVVDEKDGLANSLLLPAGPLRELPSAARRASLLWLSRCTSADSLPPAQLPVLPRVCSAYEPVELLDLSLRRAGSPESLKGARVLGVCGISRPDSFASTLRGLGVNLRGLEVFPDHHSYSEADIRRLLKIAELERCEWVLTTEKDALKLLSLSRENGPFRVLRMSARILGDSRELDILLERFSR